MYFANRRKMAPRKKTEFTKRDRKKQAENREPKKGTRYTRNKKNSYLMKRIQEVIDIEKRTF